MNDMNQSPIANGGQRETHKDGSNADNQHDHEEDRVLLLVSVCPFHFVRFTHVIILLCKANFCNLSF